MKRSYHKELLDNPDIPFGDIKKNMEELAVINHLLGGHKITLEGVMALAKNHPVSEPLHIVEIGCGGGNNLFVIKEWAAKNDIPVLLTGIDIHPECINYANAQARNQNVRFICSDYRMVVLSPSPHIIFSSLFCHHFTEDELVAQLQWMHRNSSLGFFINDLHRHPMAYRAIKVLTKLFSRSYLVKNDAPLSVQRGFIKKDWKDIFHKAGIQQFTIHWKWAFRWLVVCFKEFKSQ